MTPDDPACPSGDVGPEFLSPFNTPVSADASCTGLGSLAQEQFSLLVQSVVDHALYLIDPGGRVVSWNPGAERVKGWAEAEIIGQHYEVFYIEQDRAAGLPKTNMSTTLVEGRLQTEGWRVRKDGTRFWAQVVMTPVTRSDGMHIGFAKITRDMTEPMATEARLNHLSQHDPATGLPNRGVFIGRLEATLCDAARTGVSVSLIDIDLDRFKEINDIYGHTVGDEALKTIGERLACCVNNNELIACTGSDEFLALQSTATTESLNALLDRLERVFNEPLQVQGVDIRVEGSMGVACYPRDAGDSDKLLDNAALALRRAKARLPGSICHYESAMDEFQREQRSMARAIVWGIGAGEFFLHYQPQCAAGTNEVLAYEALSRWQHPQWGLVPSDRFIRSAENSGVIVQLGEWVLHTACQEAASWNKPYRVAVNLSPLHLASVDLPEQVGNILKRTGLAPHRLEIEITETALIGDRQRAMKTLHLLREAGIKIALDDFGIGYSSLETLRSFPFDKIKIDRSFIACLASNRIDKAFVKAIITLARSLSIAVLAEGVETELQRVLLEHEGCDEMQGYLFGYPDTSEQLGLYGKTGR
ncbi:MAG: putative bifunctional diguanylate cyclase/phosphodiesterase [Parahaliea sp.]